MKTTTYVHPLGIEIDEPTHWLEITYADDPEANENTAVFPDELLARFPVVKSFMDSDPDFRLEWIVGLMQVTIRPTYWNS